MSSNSDEATPLAERLRERIRRDGPISFRDFMAAALYDPAGGYYARGPRIGEGGDFVTSPHVSPAFAAAIAERFRRDAEELGGVVDFVELAAGEGRFLADFDAALRRAGSGRPERIRYTAVDTSAGSRRALAQLSLSADLRILESAEGLAERSIRGWIFSNELFDALPVFRVEGAAAGAREQRVDVAGNAFRWTRSPAPGELAAYLKEFGVRLAPGQAAEICLEAAPLYGRLARALERGRMVTVDYGHRAAVLYHPVARPRGTLAVHAGGKRRGHPLAKPGEVDLTAHVNWDALIREGEQNGLATTGLVRQGRYLIESGLFDATPTDAERWRAYRLVDPEGMGEELSVLIQSRGIG